MCCDYVHSLPSVKPLQILLDPLFFKVGSPMSTSLKKNDPTHTRMQSKLQVSKALSEYVFSHGHYLARIPSPCETGEADIHDGHGEEKWPTFPPESACWCLGGAHQNFKRLETNFFPRTLTFQNCLSSKSPD